MDTLYDGGTPFLSSMPPHNNNASLVMSPRPTADITGGKVLHVTFEVDAHFDPNQRRWVEIQIAPAGEALLFPGKFADNGVLPVPSGNDFRWQITGQFHEVDQFDKSAAGKLEQFPLIDLSYSATTDRFGPAARIRWDGFPLNNGTSADLDHRHKFDLYLSQTRFRILESGVVIKDGALARPLTFSKMSVYFVHQFYHSDNERAELTAYFPNDPFWINYRPFSDERHWDNMGFEVLNAFPS